MIYELDKNSAERVDHRSRVVSGRSCLRVLSIAHGAVRRDIGRLRYHQFKGMSEMDVHLVGPDRWREYGRTMIADPGNDEGITLHIEPIRFPYLPAVNWYAHYYPGLRKLLERVRPDVIHLWEEPWSLVALQATRLRGNAALVLEVDQNILKRLPQPFESIRRYVLKHTDVILSRSTEATEVVRACGFKGRVHPIGYGVDQNVFHPSSVETRSSSDKPLTLGYVGRLSKQKGLDDVLDAVAMAKSPARLAIMGEGPYGDQLQQRVGQLGLGSRVTQQGWGSPTEVSDFVRRLDVSLLLSRTMPSWKEQFGRAIIESQSCGVPVIGSNSGAIPDVVGAGGWLVPERDPLALAHVIDRLSNSRREIAERGFAGLANVAARFTYKTTAQALAAAWRDANSINRRTQTMAGSQSNDIPAHSNKSAMPLRSASKTNEAAPAPFRIVQVVRDLAAGGGIEVVAYELAKAWERAGIPTLTITRKLQKLSSGIETKNVARWLARVPTRGAFRYSGRLLVVPAFTIAATAALREHRDAIVVSHGDSFAGDVLVVHAVNAASLDEKKRAGIWKWRLNPLHLWVGLRDRFMIGGLRYRQFVALSPRAGAEVQKYYNVPASLISVIPNGIDLDKFKPDAAAGQAIRAEFGIAPDVRLLLFVGHEFTRKGLAYVIGALNQLEDNVSLLVVGSDVSTPYRHLFKGRRERLVFAGERSDMPGFYAAADAFVFPTSYEIFPLAVMEAMACGVPIFATRVSGIEDYLEDGVNGYSIDRNAEDIAVKLKKVLDDPDHLAELRTGARATMKNYAWDLVAARYVTLLKEVWHKKMQSQLPNYQSSDGA